MSMASDTAFAELRARQEERAGTATATWEPSPAQRNLLPGARVLYDNGTGLRFEATVREAPEQLAEGAWYVGLQAPDRHPASYLLKYVFPLSAPTAREPSRELLALKPGARVRVEGGEAEICRGPWQGCFGDWMARVVFPDGVTYILSLRHVTPLTGTEACQCWDPGCYQQLHEGPSRRLSDGHVYCQPCADRIEPEAPSLGACSKCGQQADSRGEDSWKCAACNHGWRVLHVQDCRTEEEKRRDERMCLRERLTWTEDGHCEVEASFLRNLLDDYGKFALRVRELEAEKRQAAQWLNGLLGEIRASTDIEAKGEAGLLSAVQALHHERDEKGAENERLTAERDEGRRLVVERGREFSEQEGWRNEVYTVLGDPLEVNGDATEQIEALKAELRLLRASPEPAAPPCGDATEGMGEDAAPHPCPFCGSVDIHYQSLADADFARYFCEACGTQGPPGDDSREALERWNRCAEGEPKELAEAREALYEAGGGVGYLPAGIRSIAARVAELRKDKDGLFDQLDKAERERQEEARGREALGGGQVEDLLRRERTHVAEIGEKRMQRDEMEREMLEARQELAALRAQPPATEPAASPCGEAAREEAVAGLKTLYRVACNQVGRSMVEGEHLRQTMRACGQALLNAAEPLAWTATIPPAPASAEGEE